MNLKLKRTPGIYVVGFMGAGKSTVGRHLAHRLGWSFFDIDAEIDRPLVEGRRKGIVGDGQGAALACQRRHSAQIRDL